MNASLRFRQLDAMEGELNAIGTGERKGFADESESETTKA